MKINFSFLFLVSAFATLTAQSGTFTVTENFESYAADAFVTDTNNWSTTDQWQNNGIVTDAPNGKAGWVGGLAKYSTNSQGSIVFTNGPTTPTTYLTREFEAQDNNRFTFRWTQNIANAASDDGIRDKFGWTVKSTDGTDLLTLMFLNVNLPGQNLLAQGYSGSLLGATVGNKPGIIGVSNRGEWAQFEIVLDSAANTWSASLFNANPGVNAWQTFIEGGSVNGASGSYTVGKFSAVWDLADKTTTTEDSLANNTPVDLYTGAGKNVMYLDDLSISGVPEPSSLSLFTFGALAYLASRRRSRS